MSSSAQEQQLHKVDLFLPTYRAVRCKSWSKWPIPMESRPWTINLVMFHDQPSLYTPTSLSLFLWGRLVTIWNAIHATRITEFQSKEYLVLICKYKYNRTRRFIIFSIFILLCL